MAGEDPGSGSGSSTRSGGVDGGSSASESGVCAACVVASETPEARRVASEDAEELVASRRYSTTSHVWSVASGAKETRRLAMIGVSRVLPLHAMYSVPSDFRRASRRFLSSSSFEARMDLTAGMKADYAPSAMLERSSSARSAHTLRRFPLVSFSAGASGAPRPPGPMLLLRVFREDFFDDSTGALKDAPATSPSAMFSLPRSLAMVRGWRCRGGDASLLRLRWEERKQNKQGKTVARALLT